MENNGILNAIEVFGRVNEGKTDKETHKIVKQTLRAMATKQRQEWPDKELRTVVNNLDKMQYNYFFLIMKDMDDGLTEAYGNIEV